MISSAHLNAFGEPTGGGSEVAVPVFIQLPEGSHSTGARAGDPLHASPCFLVKRDRLHNIVEATPLKFFRLELFRNKYGNNRAVRVSKNQVHSS